MKWLQFISFTIHQLWKEFQAHHYIRKHFPTAQIEPNVTLKGPLENLILGKTGTNPIPYPHSFRWYGLV